MIKSCNALKLCTIDRVTPPCDLCYGKCSGKVSSGTILGYRLAIHAIAVKVRLCLQFVSRLQIVAAKSSPALDVWLHIETLCEPLLVSNSPVIESAHCMA